MISSAEPFDEARADCVKNGGDLAVIDTEQDLNETLEAIQASGSRLHFLSKSNDVWMTINQPMSSPPAAQVVNKIPLEI